MSVIARPIVCAHGVKAKFDSRLLFGQGVRAQPPASRPLPRTYAGGPSAPRQACFDFTLSAQVRRDAHSQELQVPRVAPRGYWPRLARAPQVVPTTWTTLEAPAASGEVPPLVALGELQHWLRTSLTGDFEEREASAYWAVCAAQQQREQRLRAVLRREGVQPADVDAVSSNAVAGASPAEEVPGWVQAATVLRRVGLTGPTTAKEARREAAGGLLRGAAAAGRAGTWGARLTAEALGTWRGWTSGNAQTSFAVTDFTQASASTPERAYAACLGEMIAVAKTRPEALLPAPGNRHQLMVTLRVAPEDASFAAEPDRATKGVPSVTQHWDVVVASVNLDEGGPAQSVHLAPVSA